MGDLRNWEDVESAIIEMTGKQPRLKDDEHIHDCPFCDKPGHFYVNYEKGVYNCYRCGGDDTDGRGGIFKLAELMGVTPETDDLDLSQGVTVEQLDTELSAIYVAADGILGAPLELLYDRNEMPVAPPQPFEFVTPANWFAPRVQEAVCYLETRGITGYHIKQYCLGITVFWKSTEIVFPDFNRYRQVRWWQRRGIAQQDGPKYMGPEGDKAGKIGNWYQALAQPLDYIGVCEGPISGIVAGLEFTWLWGKEYSPEQMETLLSADKKIVIALDGEAKAFNNAIGLATELRGRGGEAIIVPMPGEHDPASLGYEQFRVVLDQTLRHGDGSDLDFLERVVNDYVR